MLIAPLSANTLAKLANGMCDNLLTCIARAWDYSTVKGKTSPTVNLPLAVSESTVSILPSSPSSSTTKHLALPSNNGCNVGTLQYPLIVAPSMNTLMYNHPFTELQLNILRQLGVSVIPPVVKRLACGDYGNGAMATVENIVDTVKQALH